MHSLCFGLGVLCLVCFVDPLLGSGGGGGRGGGGGAISGAPVGSQEKQAASHHVLEAPYPSAADMKRAPEIKTESPWTFKQSVEGCTVSCPNGDCIC